MAWDSKETADGKGATRRKGARACLNEEFDRCESLSLSLPLSSLSISNSPSFACLHSPPIRLGEGRRERKRCKKASIASGSCSLRGCNFWCRLLGSIVLVAAVPSPPLPLPLVDSFYNPFCLFCSVCLLRSFLSFSILFCSILSLMLKSPSVPLSVSFLSSD